MRIVPEVPGMTCPLKDRFDEKVDKLAKPRAAHLDKITEVL